MSRGTTKIGLATLRVPSHKHSPKFTDDVPAPVQRLTWIRWLEQHAVSERPYLHLSRVAAARLAALLKEAP